MFQRFSDSARRVVVLAQEEARSINHNYIGTEHLLLGLIQEGEGMAAKALGDLGDARAVGALAGLVERARTPVRVNAVVALGRIGDEGAVDALTYALRSDESADARRAAARALGEVRSPRGVDALLGALGTEEHDWVRRAAAERVKDIARHKEEVIEAFLKNAHGERDNVPISVSRLMQELADSLKPRTVVVDERADLIPIHLKPLAHRLCVVVVALIQLAPIGIARVGLFGRVELDVIGLAASAAQTAAAHALDEHIIGHHDVGNQADLVPSVAQSLAQSLGLCDGAGKAVEQCTTCTVRSTQSVHHHTDSDVIRHQVSSVHKDLGLFSELSLVFEILPKQVATGDVGQTEGLAQPGRLGSLP